MEKSSVLSSYAGIKGEIHLLHHALLNLDRVCIVRACNRINQHVAAILDDIVPAESSITV